ncbi:MAG: serine hydrolase domain-containing protein [Thermoanaerobaculia bacterium]
MLTSHGSMGTATALFAILASSLTTFAASAPGLDRNIDAMAHEVMQSQRIPGMALCVLQGGRLLASRAYGIADLENDVPVTNETEFSIASITKQLTAAAVLQLSERGLVRLDDDISRFVPDFPVRNAGVTLRRLLNHTAGIRNLQDLGDRYWKQSAAPAKPRDIIRLFESEPLDFKPGTDYHYSNSGYILLGAVIEKASGETYGEYLRKHLFEPLHLKHMTYGGSSALIPHRARGYWVDGSAFINAAHYDDSQAFSMGGVYSNAEDLAKWVDALHHGRVLKPESYNEMITPEVLPNGEKLTYGGGVELGEVDGRHVLSHAGGGVGFIGQALYVREGDLVVVVLTNSSVGGGAIEMADRIMRQILAIPGPADLPLPAGLASRFAGHYRMGSDAVDVDQEGGHLVIRYGKDDVHRLRYQGESIFAQDGRLSRVHFREVDGRVVAFEIARYGSFLARAKREDR